MISLGPFSVPALSEPAYDEEWDGETGLITDVAKRHASDLRDEAPSAYKDIHRVMRAQGELVKVVRVLKPVLVYKGA